MRKTTGLLLFALAAMMACPQADAKRRNKKNICKLLLNTYLAGLKSLKRIK